MFVIYDFIFLVFAICYFPYAVIKGKCHRGLWFRFGFIPKPVKGELQQKDNIWIHAVSVGEVLAVHDLIRKIKRSLPAYNIVCSTVTKSGYRLACSKLSQECTVIFAPFDFSWITKTFVSLIRPVLYISAETEIWPNLYARLHQCDIPIVQVNGRISDRSFKRYKLVTFLTKRVLSFVTLFCMQSQLDAQRIAKMGADKNKILIAGNLKFDNLPHLTILNLKDLGFDENDELLIAGSTHPGEEQIMIDIYKRLVVEFPHLRLVLCPRHVERTEELERLLEDNQLFPIRFSEIREREKGAGAVYLIDTIGHLRDLYQVAKLVFIGKTLFVGGGQNMIEPSFYGKPTFVGPMTFNFKDVMRIFLEENAIVQVREENELFDKMNDLLHDPPQLDAIGNRAKRIVERYQGATTKTVEVISEILKK